MSLHGAHEMAPDAPDQRQEPPRRTPDPHMTPKDKGSEHCPKLQP